MKNIVFSVLAILLISSIAYADNISLRGEGGTLNNIGTDICYPRYRRHSHYANTP